MPQKSSARNRKAAITGKTPEKPERLGTTQTLTLTNGDATPN